MEKEQIIEYIMHTPHNANPSVLKGMLNNLSGSSEPVDNIQVEIKDNKLSITGTSISINNNSLTI